MRFYLLALFAFLISPVVSMAQTPAVAASPEALQLIETIHLMDIVQQNSDAAVDKMVQTKAKSFPPAVQAKLQPMIKEEFQKSVAANQVEFKNDVATLLSGHFNPSELKEINGFFKTPTGQKLATSWPAMQPEFEALSKKWSKKIQGDVMSNVMVRLTSGK